MHLLRENCLLQVLKGLARGTILLEHSADSIQVLHTSARREALSALFRAHRKERRLLAYGLRTLPVLFLLVLHGQL